jgi:hypothetical protein
MRWRAYRRISGELRVCAEVVSLILEIKDI